MVRVLAPSGTYGNYYFRDARAVKKPFTFSTFLRGECENRDVALRNSREFVKRTYGFLDHAEVMILFFFRQIVVDQKKKKIRLTVFFSEGGREGGGNIRFHNFGVHQPRNMPYSLRPIGRDNNQLFTESVRQRGGRNVNLFQSTSKKVFPARQTMKITRIPNYAYVYIRNTRPT